MSETTFGTYLKALRLQQGHGLRTFAEQIDMFPSNLSDIEHGKKAPPQDPQKLAQMARALGLSKESEAWAKLHDLAVEHVPGRLPPDLAAYAANSEMVPFLLRTVANKKLSEQELKKLVATIKKNF